MSKRAEEAALKAYPEQLNIVAGPYPCEPFTTDTNAVLRKAHKEGYELAEKDLALTAEDVSCIIHLADQFGKDYQKIANVFNKDREEENETQ